MYCSLNILWHCPSLGLKWKLTFSSPVATAEFSRFADVLSAALISNQFGVSSISHVCSLLSNPKAISPVLGTSISHLDLMNSHLTDNPVSTPASLQALCFLQTQMGPQACLAPFSLLGFPGCPCCPHIFLTVLGHSA